MTSQEAVKEYTNIVTKALLENRTKEMFKGKYSAYHHILPKSVYSVLENKKWNTVLLSASEHYRCHALLVLMSPKGTKLHNCMVTAFMLLTNENKSFGMFEKEIEENIYCYMTPEQYEEICNKYVELHRLYGTEAQRNMSEEQRKFAHKRQCEVVSSPEQRKANSDRLKAYFKKPGALEKHSKRQREFLDLHPEVKEKISNTLKGGCPFHIILKHEITKEVIEFDHIRDMEKFIENWTGKRTCDAVFNKKMRLNTVELKNRPDVLGKRFFKGWFAEFYLKSTGELWNEVRVNFTQTELKEMKLI